MDRNEVLGKLRDWYPGLSFKIEKGRLYVNNQKLCVVGDERNNTMEIPDTVVRFIKTQIRETVNDSEPENVEHGIVNIPTIGSLKKAIFNMPDNLSLIGNCVDMFDRWYNYPCYIGKVPGKNDMVSLQLKPLDENQITTSIANFTEKANYIADMVYKKTGQDIKDDVVREILALIGH